MSKLYLLDTDTSSYLIKGRPATVRTRLAEVLPSQVCISVITAAELLYGLKSLPEDHRIHVAAHEFLRLLRALPWDLDAAHHYATIRRQLALERRSIGELDMMIAAHAVSLGAVLVTSNTRHYERIKLPLTLENWAGSGRSH